MVESSIRSAIPEAPLTFVETAKKTFAAFGDDKVMRLASAISFSAIFSIAPLFILLIAVLAAFAGGHGAAQEHLLGFVRNSAGNGAADQLRQIIAASYDKPREGLIAQIVGWVAFVFAASNLFAALQDALNTIWQVEAAKGGWKQMLRDRVASSGMIVIVGILLALVFVANAAVAFVTQHLQGIPLASNPALLTVATQLVSLGVEALVFGLIFKVLPDVDIDWKHALFGGAITAVLFTIGQVVIGIYFTRGGVASTYGAAGSLLVALLWIYYSTVILLLGAEITKVTAGTATLSTKATVKQTAEMGAGSDPRAAESASK